MQLGVVVAGGDVERVPACGVQVRQGVVALAGKAEQPVAGGEAGNVRLVDGVDGEERTATSRPRVSARACELSLVLGCPFSTILIRIGMRRQEDADVSASS